MGKSLSEGSPAARALYAEAANVLGWDLAKVSFEGPEAELTQTKVCQPALLCTAWRCWPRCGSRAGCRPASRGSPRPQPGRGHGLCGRGVFVFPRACASSRSAAG